MEVPLVKNVANERTALAEPLLTVSEAAKLLRISPWTLYHHVQRGILPAVRIGRRVRFSRAALEAWLEGQAAAAAGEAR